MAQFILLLGFSIARTYIHTLPCANIHAPPHTHTYIYIYTYAYTVTNNNITYLYIFTICHISIYITHINAHSDTDIYLLWISWVVNRPPGRSGGLVQLTAGRGDSQRPPAKDGADRGPGTPKYQRLIDIACWILGYFAFFWQHLVHFLRLSTVESGKPKNEIAGES